MAFLTIASCMAVRPWCDLDAWRLWSYDPVSEVSTPSLLPMGSTPVRSMVQATARAALLISVTTSSGWDTIATWFVGTSVVVAFIRLANRRSASAGIA
jgi:hypothetical protein